MTEVQNAAGAEQCVTGSNWGDGEICHLGKGFKDK